jgi:G3E family GTPase
VNPIEVFDVGGEVGERRPMPPKQWLADERYRPALASPSVITSNAPHPHDKRIRSFAIFYEGPISGKSLWAGLERLIDNDGDKLLRVKGIVNAAGLDGPRVIHIVQHVLYPVTSLPDWPDDDRRTRLVFIVRDLDPAYVRATLDGALAEAA